MHKQYGMSSRKKRVTKLSGMTEEERCEYIRKWQHDYYLRNQDKAKEYQRRYGLEHKKKQHAPPKRLLHNAKREQVRRASEKLAAVA